jgi:exonuclease V
MKVGSIVHQTLEDEVHTTVPVNVASKEEAFGLRIWNLIQGLRTLRETGITRELEVWGTVHGHVVNGVIDQLSYSAPDDGSEEKPGSGGPQKATQSSITNYIQTFNRQVLLTDIKTRASARLPSGAALKPAKIQLLLYHRLLSGMAADRVDYSAIVSRYGLQMEAQFSDSFMAELGGVWDEIFGDGYLYSKEGTTSAQLSHHSSSGLEADLAVLSHATPTPDSLKYRSIGQLIPLLRRELQMTFTRGADSLADTLAVEYRHRDGGRIIGSHFFANHVAALDSHLERNMDWWLGRREAEGVAIEETYKCRSCEFADTCQWRIDKEKELLQRKAQNHR